MVEDPRDDNRPPAMQDAPSLSVVVITRNEADNLPRLLKSVAHLADEVVVFDSGSTDGTPSLAAAAGARVVDCPWEGWSTTKNKANSEATGDWILSLDADEAPDAKCLQAIRDHIAIGPRTANGAWRAGEVNRITNYCGQWIRHSGWYPDRKVRLWPSGAAEWQGAIHEVPHFNAPMVVSRLAGTVEHFSYPNRASHLDQIEKFGRVWAEDRHAQGYSAPLMLVWLKVMAQWLKTYILRQGWRDGRAGWNIARLSAWATWRKHARLRALQAGEASPPRSILVCRTDALGDLVLSLPIATALNRHFPNAKIDLLVRPYAASVAKAATDVHEVVEWTESCAKDPSGTGSAVIGEGQYDAAVVAFPDASVIKACVDAGIAMRIGTGRRWHSWRRLTHRNWDGRKDSGGHEAWHGLRLLLPFGIEANMGFEDTYLQPPAADAHVQSAIDACGSPPVLLHPGSHGSADNWSPDRFAQLAEQLLLRGFTVGFTGTDDEGQAFAPHMPSSLGVHDWFGRFDLNQLLALQSRAVAVVASSTGPLHTATAMGRPGIGLYGTTPPEWAARWRPIGPSVRVLSTEHRDENGGLDIPVEQVLDAVLEMVRTSERG